MSRVGKAPITIPDGVKVEVANNLVTATGPKGKLEVQVHPELLVKMENGVLEIQRPSDEKRMRSLHGLTRTLVFNAVEGVSKGFEKKLEIVGVGFRAEMKGTHVLLSLGYSHQIIVAPPQEITFATEGNNIVVVRGINKELVGQIAAKIRSLRKPEPYKGKGVRYLGEVVRKKAGKTAA
ncbi:MAG TPA: 50S ribosomal protein L6 [bacterium]|nr:50S ribosomal protein L6 [bacterium]HPR88523.1 50S ribosomal protein L6 [bacterium]